MSIKCLFSNRGGAMECKLNQSLRRKQRLASFALTIFASLVFVFLVPQAYAAKVALKDIKIDGTDSGVKINFEFGLPLRYVRHFPQTSGEILQIQLVAEQPGSGIHKEVKQGEQLATAGGQEQLLVYVTYEEGVPGGPYLTLRFARPVEFSIDAGDDTARLAIKVEDTLFGGVARSEAEGDAQADAGADVAAPASKPAVPEISMRALEEQVFKQAEKSEKVLDERKDQVQEEKPKDEQQAATPAPKPPKPVRKQDKASDEVSELMAKARQALTFGDNEGAIQLLRKVIAMPENEHTQDARELVGLALERSNQIPRAKFEYKKYLKIYKEGEGPTRVRQRLAALQSIITEKRQKLRRAKRTEEGQSYTVFGRMSQAYSARFQQREPENDDDRVGSEDLVLTRRVDSNFTVRGRYRTTERNVQAIFTANHTLDLIDSEETEARVSALYLDYDVFKHGYYSKIGRFRERNSGIFGRIDGAIAGYDVLPWMRASAFLGSPVELNDDRDLDKNAWGFKIDIGKRNDPVNMNLYMVRQTADDYDDRNAVGIGMRYNDKEMTLFGTMDYDVLFDEINLLNLRWGWSYLENSKLNITYNRRQLLFFNSALRSQPLGATLDDLVAFLGNEDEVRQLAKDRTSLDETITIGNSYQFDRDNQLNVDLTAFSSSGTVDRFDLNNPADCQITGNCQLNNVEGAPATGNQYSLSGQFIAGNLFAERDLYVFGLRMSNFDTYNDITTFVNARLPDFGLWKPRPRLTASYRKFKDDEDRPSSATGNRKSIAPSVKVDYAWKREWIFDFEIGFEWVQYSDERFDDEVHQNIRIGYNYSF